MLCARRLGVLPSVKTPALPQVGHKPSKPPSARLSSSYEIFPHPALRTPHLINNRAASLFLLPNRHKQQKNREKKHVLISPHCCRLRVADIVLSRSNRRCRTCFATYYSCVAADCPPSFRASDSIGRAPLARVVCAMDQTTSAAAAVSKSRKRRRNHQRTSTGTINSGTPTTLPRVTTAPANLGRAQSKTVSPGPRIASSNRGTARAAAAAARPPVSPPFASSADLDAQISTLNLINMYGYGPVPGTPLLRAKTPPALGRPRCRTRDAPNVTTAVADGTTGEGAVGCGTVTDRNPARNTADKRVERPSRHARGPWMGTKVRYGTYVRTYLYPY